MPKANDTISFHRRIISKAVQIAWKHKHLWVFGFFAAFSGFGGAFEALMRVYDRVQGTMPAPGGNLGLGFLPGLSAAQALITFAPSPWLALLIYGLIGLIVAAIFAWAVVMALGAAVAGVKGVIKGKDIEFAEALKEAGDRFWPLLAIVVLIKLASLAAAVVIGVNLVKYYGSGDLFSGIFFFLSFAVYAALAVVIAMIGVFSVTALIDGRKLTARQAIQKGWQTFSDNWLVSVEAGILVMLVQIAVMLVAIVALLVLSVPFIFLLMLAVTFNLPVMAMAIGVLVAIVVILLMCLLAAYLTVFQVAVWWQLWHEFSRFKLVAGLERWLGRLWKNWG